MRKSLLSLAALLALSLSLAAPSSAQSLNLSAIRGTVSGDAVPDCYTCNLSGPHGCFVQVNTGDDNSFTVHMEPTAGYDCGGLTDGACISMSGKTGNFIVAIPTVGAYQVEAFLWFRAPGLCS